jgi:N-succinyl-L-ornithine transcarbamylase
MEFEFENGAIMNQALLNTSKKPPKWSQHCDIIAVRAFLISRQGKDNETFVFKFATVPIVNMEGCTGHPFRH